MIIKPTRGAQSLKRRERLKSKKTIELLFESGKSFSKYPLKIFYQLVELDEEQVLAQFAVAIPSRIFKKAVQRNLLKRRIREAYRLHKNNLLTGLLIHHKKIHFIIVYTAKEVQDYHTIEKAMQQLLDCLEARLD